MKAPDFEEKLNELRGLMDAEHVPPRVKTASLRLSELQKKLFFGVGDPVSIGTPQLLPGLHASDFLAELVLAYRALDWPRVIILIHQASSDDGDAL